MLTKHTTWKRPISSADYKTNQIPFSLSFQYSVNATPRIPISATFMFSYVKTFKNTYIFTNNFPYKAAQYDTKYDTINPPNQVTNTSAISYSILSAKRRSDGATLFYSFR
jgi:hypothetical protein